VAGSLGLGPSVLMGLLDGMIAAVSGAVAAAHYASSTVVVVAA
jgi:hypothetical protein